MEKKDHCNCYDLHPTQPHPSGCADAYLTKKATAAEVAVGVEAPGVEAADGGVCGNRTKKL